MERNYTLGKEVIFDALKCEMALLLKSMELNLEATI